MKASIAAVIILGAIGATPTTSQQVFRASTDVVTVDVSVRTNGSRVGGLAAKDFVLLDNGVSQRIDAIESSIVPVDVTLLVDTDAEVADHTDDITKQATRIAAMLRPIDRLRVWNIDTTVTEIVPLAAAGPHPTLPPMGHAGLAPVNDAIAAALMEPVAPDARHLIIAMTNSIDTDSVLSLDAVRAIAAKSNATLHVSQIDVIELPNEPNPPIWLTGAEDLRKYQCSVVHKCEPTHLFWQPHYTPPQTPERFAPLEAIAEGTGGTLHTLGLFVEHNAADVFENAFKDFQTNYILRYTPAGVAREGWHSISVTTPGYSGYQIRARRGYSMDGGAVATPAAAAPADVASMAAVTALAGRADRASEIETVIQAYGRADYGTALSAAHRIDDEAALLRSARGAGDIWPAAPHREAVFALELAQMVLSSQTASVRTAALDWLTAEARLVRPPLDVAPDSFEHEWLTTALDLLQGPINSTVAQPFVNAALTRFPADARFVLASAIVTDQRWPIGSDNVLTPAQSSRQVSEVVSKYDDAIRHIEAPDVVAEAHVREAWLLHRVSRDRDALAQLDAVRDTGADPVVQYLRYLFRGHVLSAMGRVGDAIEAYRAAIPVYPRAQSGRIALMNGLLATGDREAALALSESIQTTPPVGLDPWQLYWQGDYRRFPDAIARLRQQAR